ncbi:hypothetical protein niasHS_017199 [Heterodera schachtii]|uniref:Uncharacterized protein n=1 Tax=Heterodera schachtii TaxID=97005 RepID=A0ABD2I0J4_HETSC
MIVSHTIGDATFAALTFAALTLAAQTFAAPSQSDTCGADICGLTLAAPTDAAPTQSDTCGADTCGAHAWPRWTAGMILTLVEGTDVEALIDQLSARLNDHLALYAVPVLMRICDQVDRTGTFKLKKTVLQLEWRQKSAQ